MTICCVTGDRTQEYLISEVTKKVEDGHELAVAMSEQATFKDYTALSKPISLPLLTLLIRNRISDSSTSPLVMVLPDLSAPVESLSDFFNYIRLAGHLPIDLFIGMSHSEIAQQLEELDTVKINAAENHICIERKYEYLSRKHVNDVIYTALAAKRNGGPNP